MNIINLELSDHDAHRLLWLVQREAGEGKVWDRYWETLARHIRQNISLDTEAIAQIEYQETLAASKRLQPATTK